MSTWATDERVADERITHVRTTEDDLVVHLEDGRALSLPLVWYPRLLEASEDQREDWILTGGGHGIHWPRIDEDLSVEGLILGVPAPAARRRPPRLRAEAQAARARWARIIAEETGVMDTRKADSDVPDDEPGRLPRMTTYLPEEAAAQALRFEMVAGAQAEARGEVAEQAQGATGGATRQAQEETARPHATRAAVKKAEELGVDLSRLEGSGANGRIVVRDVSKAADEE